MTISSAVRKAGPFAGAGTTSEFPFEFKVFNPEDLYVVKLRVSTGTETVLTLDSDYLVTLNEEQDDNPGGTITLVTIIGETPAPTPLASGYKLTITSALEYLQPTDLTNQGGFYPQVITDALDRETIFTQQLNEQMSRSLKIPISSPATVSTEMPIPEPSKLVGWDSGGEKLINVDASTLATLVAYGTANADIFDANGSETAFGLSDPPGALANLDVSIDGVTQIPGIDYSLNGAQVLVFSAAPPIGAKILARYMQGLPSGGGGGGVDPDEITGIIDGTYILDKIAGQITESELYQALNSRIDLIDAPTTGLVTQVGGLTTAVETTHTTVSSLTSTVTTLQATVADLSGTPTYDNAATYAEGDMVAYDGGLYQALGTTTGHLPTDPTYWLKIGDYASLGEAVAANSAAIAQINTVSAESTSAIAQAVAQVSTTVAGHTTSIETSAESIDGLKSQFTVKIDNNGFMSGFGLASDASTVTPVSEFYAQVGRFAVINPAATPVAITSITRSGTVATVTATSHGVIAGDYIVVTGAEQSDYNGTKKVLTVPTVNTLTYEVTGSPATPATVAEYFSGLRLHKAKVPFIVQDGVTYIDSALVGNLQSSLTYGGNPAWSLNRDGSLIIRNSDGSILLQSGGTIDYAKVSGTKPPADADKTSSNTAAGIVNQGALATLNQVTSTYIADAAITSAKIGNLQVDSAKIADLAVNTLKIADNAVTVPVSAYTASVITLTAPFSDYVEIQSASIAATGSPILITANFTIDIPQIGTRVKIYRDSTELYNTGSNNLNSEIISINIVDTPSAGSYTYRIKVLPYLYDGESTTAYGRSLTLLMVKK